VKIYTDTALGPTELLSGEVFVISHFQWQGHRSGDDGVTVQRPGDDYLTTYPVDLGTLSVTVDDLIRMKPSDLPDPDPDKDVLVLLLRAQIGTEWINAWWTFRYAEWERNPDSLVIQQVYVYPKLDMWTERDPKYNVADGVDKQAFVLEPGIDDAGRLIVNSDRDPVILVHGLHGKDGYWHEIPQQLRDLGHDVWEFYYPGDQNIRFSAGLLADAISIVQDKYPGRQVNLVGHSMGGLVTRAYLEGLGLLSADEREPIPAGDMIPYQGKVRKWVSLGTPHHGIYAVVQFLRGQYDNLGCGLAEQIKELFRGDYDEEPAYKQLAMGSRFMWELNQAPFPLDLLPERDLLSIIGTQTPGVPGLQGCAVTDHLNDGIIDLISASLLDSDIPLLTISKNHGSIIGHSFPLPFVGENRDTENVSNILDRFFRDSDYNTGKEDARVVLPDQDPYEVVSPAIRRAGLVVRYADSNDRAVTANLLLSDPSPVPSPAPLTPAPVPGPAPVPSPSKHIDWNSNESAAISIPSGPPLAYARTQYASSLIGVTLESGSRKTFTLTANGRSQSVELQSGHFEEMVFCEDSTPMQMTQPPEVTPVWADEVLVEWKTSRPATSEVRYGVTSDLEFSHRDQQLVTEHSVRLTNLTPYQGYLLQVRSTSDCGGQVESQRIQFRPGEIPEQPRKATSTATMLVMDVSGSMGDPWHGGVKIESAKAAAIQILNLIQRESEISRASHQVGLAVFSTDAALNLQLTADYDKARSAIAAMGAGGGTNIGAGLAVANDELTNAPSDVERIVILLSDGQTNEGLSPDEILRGPVQDAVNADTCIYTVGFGDPGDLDEDLLQRIAQATECGQYYYAPDAFQLKNVYVRLRHQSTGTIAKEFSGQVAQGETTPPERITVPANQGELHATVQWPGSQLDLILIDPRGRQVNENYPGATTTTFPDMVYTVIKNPAAGAWQASVFGRDVPEGTADFSAIFSTRSRPPISWFEIMPFLIMLVTGLGMWFFVWLNQQSPGVVAPSVAGLRIASGPQAGRAVPFRRDALTIGRGPNNDVALQDTRASRNHAQIRREPEGFVLYDQGSMNGTFVNGQQVSRRVLRSGDHIRVGETELVFEGPAGGRVHGGRARRPRA